MVCNCIVLSTVGLPAFTTERLKTQSENHMNILDHLHLSQENVPSLYQYRVPPDCVITRTRAPVAPTAPTAPAAPAAPGPPWVLQCPVLRPIGATLAARGDARLD